MEAATLESVKKVLGLQVRSPGAPGPLTLKEVEELEQLTQQLMQDMEHPQRQNVAVNGEPTPPGQPHPAPYPSGLIPRSPTYFLLFTSVFSGFPRTLRSMPSTPGPGAASRPRSGAAVPHRLLHLPPVRAAAPGPAVLQPGGGAVL